MALRVMHPNTAPLGAVERDLPREFLPFLQRLHGEFTPRRQALLSLRGQMLMESHAGRPPMPLAPSAASGVWGVEVPTWCADQRNQMTGPADDAELVVKMLNSGSPGVMLDLEDSLKNGWAHLITGHYNVVDAICGGLTYRDDKRSVTVGIRNPMSPTVIWTRVRGLHLMQLGVLEDPVPASLFDAALHAWLVAEHTERLKHPVCFYIPKTEHPQEGVWWSDLFDAIRQEFGWPAGSIHCMALVESHPMAHFFEEFAYKLRDYLVGLNLGRWDYMASLAHYMFENPNWVLPDRNTIPHDVPFFQCVRNRLVDGCHRHGLLAIGGMTALYPSRTDWQLDQRAKRTLYLDKGNESRIGFDGAWTGHPDQNDIACAAFPYPNQREVLPTNGDLGDDMRPAPTGVGRISLDGTRAAARATIRYRLGVLRGKGASLLDGYMEDLATDRIYRIMLASRIRHDVQVEDTRGGSFDHTEESVGEIFKEELSRLQENPPPDVAGAHPADLELAARQSREMVFNHEFDPI